MMHLAAAALLLLAQNDQTQANSYDNPWEAGWKAHCRGIYLGGTGKTAGFVLHIGDSITISGAYPSWIRSGTNRTTQDLAIIAWFNSNNSYPAGVDVANKMGLFQCTKEVVGGRSTTACGGIRATQYVTGTGHGGPDMPGTMNTATAQGYVASATYTGNLHIQTVAAAFADAQFAVVMLGTNDCSAGRLDTEFITDIQSIVTALEAQFIVPILSTLPPRGDSAANQTRTQQYNAQLRSYAAAHGLPIIDFHAEILARQPMNWSTTLMSVDGIHPSGPGASSDAYAGGDAATHRTGTNAATDGYLLRGWLTTQKLKEVHSYVVLDAAVPVTPPTSTPSSTPRRDDDSGSGGCGGTIQNPGHPITLAIAALLTLALLVATRKTGV